MIAFFASFARARGGISYLRYPARRDVGDTRRPLVDEFAIFLFEASEASPPRG